MTADDETAQDDALLAAVFRRVLTHDAIYVDLANRDLCMDGWLHDLTDEETDAIERIIY